MPVSNVFQGEGYFLSLDNTDCGFLKSIDGGWISATVVEIATGQSLLVKKHLGSIQYEELKIEAGLSLSGALYDWIAGTWNGDAQRKDVTITIVDQNQKAVQERQFFNALITEVTIPALDGSSKEPGFLSIKFKPEYTRYRKASGKVSASLGTGKQKQWITSNFKLVIDGPDCSKVSKIDSITVKQSTSTDEIGEGRIRVNEPTRVEFPNLRVTLSKATAQSWYNWHEDFVIKGNCGEANEKSGSIALLSPDLNSELARINLSNLGIFRIAEEGATGQQIRKVVADLYCEQMQFVRLGK